MAFDGAQLEQWQRNALTVADAIEAETYGFDMSYYLVPDQCGTAGCIAGTAGAVLGVRSIVYGMVDHHEAGKVLGLPEGQRRHLFAPCCIHLADITRTHAVNVLRHYALTGEVDWSKRDTPVELDGEGQ